MLNAPNIMTVFLRTFNELETQHLFEALTLYMSIVLSQAGIVTGVPTRLNTRDFIYIYMVRSGLTDTALTQHTIAICVYTLRDT